MPMVTADRRNKIMKAVKNIFVVDLGYMTGGGGVCAAGAWEFGD